MAIFELSDGLGDWRIAAVARLAQDLPAAFPGGPSHKAGAPVYQTELVPTSKGEPLGFLTPSATAMALSIALGASRSAKRLFETDIRQCAYSRRARKVRIKGSNRRAI